MVRLGRHGSNLSHDRSAADRTRMRCLAERPPTFCQSRPGKIVRHGWNHGRCADLRPGAGAAARRASPAGLIARARRDSRERRGATLRSLQARADAAQARTAAAQARAEAAQARADSGAEAARATWPRPAARRPPRRPRRPRSSAEVASAVAQRDAARRAGAGDRRRPGGDAQPVQGAVHRDARAAGPDGRRSGRGPAQGHRAADGPGPGEPGQVQHPADRGGEGAGRHVSRAAQPRCSMSSRPARPCAGRPPPWSPRLRKPQIRGSVGRDPAQAGRRDRRHDRALRLRPAAHDQGRRPGACDRTCGSTWPRASTSSSTPRSR